MPLSCAGFCGCISQKSNRVVKQACSQGLVIKDWQLIPTRCVLRNKVFVCYLAVLLRTLTILLAVRYGDPSRLYNAETRRIILLRENSGSLAAVFIENQHKTWGFLKGDAFSQYPGCTRK